MNFILDTDSYKLSHFLGYPEDVEYMYSYAESRGGVYPATVFLGLQKYLKELAEVRITGTDVAEAREFAKAHGVPFNNQGWADIVLKHKGKIPVRIKAVPEGTLVPTRNVLVTVENTDPTMPWLTSYIETALLRATWYATTVATRIHYMKQKIKPYYELTSDVSDMSFSLLDFSARGVSSLETASIGGLGHLVHFSGSDNIPAVLAARKFYHEPMAAYSVAATEHSIMTSFGKDHELESFEYLIDNMMPENGILSVVADTWNVFDAAEKFGTLIDKIRAKNGTLVFRPDSGAFEDVIPDVLRILDKYFGSTLNSRGFKVLNNVKLLWGDGINENTVHIPFNIALKLGFSADSIMVGSGGGLMQANIDRDTCKFAFKASNVTYSDGTQEGIAKDPITDPGKKSKMGKLKLVKDYEGFHTAPLTTEWGDSLLLVYEDGKLYNEQTFADIRTRASVY